MLCVWSCNSELRHVRIFVTPCSFYGLLQCAGEARCFVGIKMAVGWQNFIENPNCPDCVGWSKEQCSFATRDCCLTDRDLTVGPTLNSEKLGRAFWSIRDLKQGRRRRQWKRRWKKWICVLSNLLASIWARSICQMQATFPGVEFLRILFRFKKRKKNSSSYAHVLHKNGKLGGFTS